MIIKSPFILWVCSWSRPQSLKTQAFSFRLGSTRVFLTCVAEVYKGNSFSVALARLGPDQTTKWPDPPSPPVPRGRGGGFLLRSGNEVIFLIALAMAFFYDFLRFWSPKTIQNEGLGPSLKQLFAMRRKVCFWTTLHGFSMIFGVRRCRRAPNFMKKTRVAKVLPQSAPKIVFLLQFNRKLGSPEGPKIRHGGLWAECFLWLFRFWVPKGRKKSP